jgi:tRNA-splicing ligase RtcB
MKKIKIRAKELRAMGYPKQGPIIGTVIQAVNTHYRRANRDWVIATLRNLLEHPAAFTEDEAFGPAARLLFLEREAQRVLEDKLHDQAKTFPIYGEDQIETGAKDQMYTAMRLPVTVAGALMPDAHYGYGLPIGGVLATDQAVIPYAVGVDIGCRMCLSVYDLAPELADTDRERLASLLQANTSFGRQSPDVPWEDPVLEREEFRLLPPARRLWDKAREQIGSSGGGNHFVEFGIAEITDPDNEFGVPVGRYLALLSHSGSRGLGAGLAQHYTQVAMRMTRLPKQAAHLAWLPLDTQEGHEYWAAMTLAGDYASACHDHIHRRMARSLGQNPLFRVENHHNFAWKQILADGREVIVHRKGATPAGRGELGVIPGSMTAPGYIVRGKGHPAALASASHGAGRQMSRSQAKQEIDRNKLNQILAAEGVTLLGGGLDEAPPAYKDIETVMAEQRELVDVVGKFYPKVVRMA